MKTSFSSQRGSAFITTIGFVMILLVLVASVLKYTVAERALNNRAKLLLETRLSAEAISEYGVAQVKQILENGQTFANSTWSANGSGQGSMFVPGGAHAGAIAMPPDGTASGTTNFWGGSHIITSGALAPTMHIGKIMLEPAGLYFIDPTNPDNANDPLKGKKVFRYNIDILSSATAQDSFTGRPLTKYWDQKFSMRAVPLFANAVYYNMDLELWPISNMTITGSTHTNGHLFVRGASSGANVYFAGAVTAVKGIWTKYADSTHPTPFLEWRSNETSTSASYPSSGGDIQILQAGTSNYKSIYLSAATTGYSPNLASGTYVESTWNLSHAVWTSGATAWQSYVGYSGDPTTTSDDVASMETAASKLNFLNWEHQTFKGNLLTHVDGIMPVNLPGIPDYTYVYGSAYPDPGTASTATMAYTYDGTAGNDTNNAAHALIERPMAASEPHYVAAIEDIKYSRLCALYIVANTTGADGTGHKPDGSTITVPAGQYRAFLTDNSTSPATITEVLLPGQKKYGAGAGNDNPYTVHANSRPIVQMKQITDYGVATNGANTEATTLRTMTDMRRTAGGNPSSDADTTFIHSSSRSSTNVFVPKVVKVIDIDMMELKKAVQTIALNISLGSTQATSSSTANGQGLFWATGVATNTGSEYPLIKASPGTSGNWSNYIYNNATTAAQTTTTLGDTTAAPKFSTHILAAPTTTLTAPVTIATTTATAAYSTATWNGGVYVESIAAEAFDTTGTSAAIRRARTHEKHDSGVRLINGRGIVASNGLQGFTLATNDCLYILGHFNADGDSTTPSPLSDTLPASVGASTGHHYETGEVPCSVVADAVYFLSQPNFSAYNTQNKGWNDQFSGYHIDGTAGSTWSSSWQTTDPGSSNNRDGTGSTTAVYPFKVPYDGGPGVFATGSNATGKKLDPVFTEYSTAVLCGLVPTGKNGVSQNSGGLHNYPRFLEDWYQGGTQVDCRIRGSFVALFECRIGTEPWSGRFYTPPIRSFGFNLLFDSGAMPPLTPKTISPRRYGANDITKDTYNSMITGWGYTALP